MSGKIVFKEHSYRIIGACFEVYKEKGNGFQECLARELAEQKVSFEEKPRLRLEYSNQTKRTSLIDGVPLGCLLPDSVGIGMPTYALWRNVPRYFTRALPRNRTGH